MGTGLLRLEYTTPAPILSPATLVPPRLAFLETSKVASSKGDFSTGLLWPSWGKTEEGPTHSSTEATSWGYQAWSGLVTKGPILFSATGALAGRRHKKCPPQSSVSPGVGSGYSEEFRPPAIFFTSFTQYHPITRDRVTVCPALFWVLQGLPLTAHHAG